MKKVLVVCTTDSMIWNFLVPHIKHMLSLNMKVECACSITGMYFDELKEHHGLIMHEIPFHRSPYNFENYYAYRELKKLIVNENFDTIFCHEPVGGAISRLAGHKTKRKVIYMAHGFHFFKGAPKINWIIYYNIEKFFSRYTDELLVINQEDYEVAKTFKAKKLSFINGIGINLDKFKRYETNMLREKYGLRDSDFIMLSVGELIPRKNHETIIKMMNIIKNEKIHLFIAGEGKLANYLQKMVADYKLENNVHFLGFCRNISEICNSCDVFIFPSVHEGLSVALMEAMACGKTIIASKIRGNTDLIDEGKGGYLVDTYDVEGYQKSVEKLIDSRKLLQKFGNYNAKKIEQFDITNVKKQLEEIYKRN